MDIESLRDLPGAELVLPGIEDLALGVDSMAARLVAIGSSRLRRLGLPIPPAHLIPTRPEHRLYAQLAQEYPEDAHSRYNALVRRLVSFEQALESRLERESSIGGKEREQEDSE